MLLAETVTFDTGDVVVILLVLFLVAAAVFTLVIGGIVAGRRWASDPTRTTARAVWAICLAAESALVLTQVADGKIGRGLTIPVIVVALTAAAGLLGRRGAPVVRSRPAPPA